MKPSKTIFHGYSPDAPRFPRSAVVSGGRPVARGPSRDRRSAFPGVRRASWTSAAAREGWASPGPAGPPGRSPASKGTRLRPRGPGDGRLRAGPRGGPGRGPAAAGCGRSPVRRVRLRGRSRAPGGSRRRPDGGPRARRGERDPPRRGAQRRSSLRGARPAARPARPGSGGPLRRRAPALVHAVVARRRPRGVGLDGFLDRERSRRPGRRIRNRSWPSPRPGRTRISRASVRTSGSPRPTSRGMNIAYLLESTGLFGGREGRAPAGRRARAARPPRDRRLAGARARVVPARARPLRALVVCRDSAALAEADVRVGDLLPHGARRARERARPGLPPLSGLRRGDRVLQRCRAGRRDRPRLPASGAQARHLRDARAAARGDGLRSRHRRRPDVRPDGVLSGARARRGRSAGDSRRRRSRDRVQRRRRGAAGPRRVAAAGRPVPRAADLLRAAGTARARARAWPTSTTRSCRPSACRSPTGRAISSSGVPASRKASACRRSRLSRAASRACFPTSRASARSAGAAASYYEDGNPRSLAAALPAMLTADAQGPRARGRAGGGRAVRLRVRRREAGARLSRGARTGGVTESSLPAVSAIVVNHRSAAEAAACVASLREAFRREAVEGEIVLVDCASGPDEIRALEAAPVDARVYLEENRGYSGGVNAGLAKARGARLILANADVIFLDGASAPFSTRSRTPASAPRRRSVSGTRPARCACPPRRRRTFWASSALDPTASRPSRGARSRSGSGAATPATSSAPSSRRAATSSTASAASTSAIPSSTRRRSGKSGSAARGSPCDSSRRPGRGTSSRAARKETPKPRRGARPRAGGIARSGGGSWAGFCSTARARGRLSRGRTAPGGSPLRSSRRATGPGSPSPPTRRSFPSPGRRSRADSGCPRTCSRRCARGPSTCAHSIPATAGRSTRASGRSRELRDSRRGGFGRARESAASSRKSSGPRCRRRSGPGSSSRIPTAGTASWACSTEKIVGHYAGWGARFQLDGETRLLYSVGDVATDPSVRGLGGRRGVYRAMTDAFYARVGSDGVPFCYGFPNARALKVSEKIVGSRTLLPVQLVKVPIESFPPPPSDAEAGELADESFDPLWESARRGISHGAIRDRGRVNWRFHARPNRYYRMVWRRGGRRDDRVGRALRRRRRRDGRGLPGPRREGARTFPSSSPPRRTKPAASAPATSPSGSRREARAARRSSRCPARGSTPVSR